MVVATVVVDSAIVVVGGVAIVVVVVVVVVVVLPCWAWLPLTRVLLLQVLVWTLLLLLPTIEC